MSLSPKELCERLLRADTADEVISVLTDEGYWADDTVWRYFGDNENNYAAVGNQQSDPVAALIEKVVNSIDSRLMDACRNSGLDPESPTAPKSIRKAVARFFDGKTGPLSDLDGRISSWADPKPTEQGRRLTLAATGNMPKQGSGLPSISIADDGEGQEPDRFPETFLSLNRSNKFRVHFVQGKFNMGGTGALRFCANGLGLQLIISRRNPKHTSGAPRSEEWGFTVVRRENPPAGGRSTVYSYLAPIDAAQPRKGSVLSFAADSFPIFPEADATARDAYARASDHGSLVKLYEYNYTGTKSHILRSTALLSKLDIGLPELALPIRLFECRPDYNGHSGSFATNVMGLSARLAKDANDNLEPGFPLSHMMRVEGNDVKALVYAFKPDKASEYRSRQGVIFVLNGQTHAMLSIEFFRKKDVNMGYLADSLLVLVDCTGVNDRMREDLFMNSRDRLSSGHLQQKLESELIDIIAHDATLKELRNRRRAEALQGKLAESEPLANVLQDLLKKSPSLSKLFKFGSKISSPFPPSGGGGGGSGEFHGKTYPTYFRFKGHPTDFELVREAHLGSRVRLALETDAENAYFTRDLDTAAWRLFIENPDGVEDEILNCVVNGPKSGIAHLNIDLPDSAVDGDEIAYRFEATDPSRIEAFINRFKVNVNKPNTGGGGPSGKTSKSSNAGKGTGGGDTALAMPNIVTVKEADWAQQKPPFTAYTALRVENSGDDAGDVFDFIVNVDNLHLKAAQKDGLANANLLRSQFTYGMVLVGLALIESDRQTATAEQPESSTTPGENVEKRVEAVTQALGPFLLPMIESLGGLAAAED